MPITTSSANVHNTASPAAAQRTHPVRGTAGRVFFQVTHEKIPTSGPVSTVITGTAAISNAIASYKTARRRNRASPAAVPRAKQTVQTARSPLPSTHSEHTNRPHCPHAASAWFAG